MMQHCTACDDTGHKRSNCPRVFTCKPPPPVSDRWSETYALRDAVLERMSSRIAKTPQEIFAEVRDDWGDVEVRRLWRALQWNVLQRRARKTKAYRDITWTCYGKPRTTERWTAAYVRRAD